MNHNSIFCTDNTTKFSYNFAIYTDFSCFNVLISFTARAKSARSNILI